MGARLAVLMLLGGCRGLLGIEEPSAPGDAGAPDDSRADGAVVGTDAPTDVPAGGHDEDADAIPDAVDNCPATPNSNQAHAGDSDAVGDACDPRPTIAGDGFGLFLPFAPPGSQPALFGAPVAANDSVVLPANTATIGTFAATQAELRVTFSNLVTNPSFQFGIGGAACTLGGGSCGGVSCLTATGSGGSTGTTTVDGQQVIGQPLVLTISRPAGSVVCKLRYASNTEVSSAAPFVGSLTGSLVMVTSDVTATMSSLLIYTMP